MIADRTRIRTYGLIPVLAVAHDRQAARFADWGQSRLGYAARLDRRRTGSRSAAVRGIVVDMLEAVVAVCGLLGVAISAMASARLGPRRELRHLREEVAVLADLPPGNPAAVRMERIVDERTARYAARVGLGTDSSESKSRLDLWTSLARTLWIASGVACAALAGSTVGAIVSSDQGEPIPTRWVVPMALSMSALIAVAVCGFLLVVVGTWVHFRRANRAESPGDRGRSAKSLPVSADASRLDPGLPDH